MQESDLLTPHQVADILNVTSETVRRLVRLGKLPGYNIGGARGSVRILRSDVSKALVASVTK